MLHTVLGILTPSGASRTDHAQNAAQRISPETSGKRFNNGYPIRLDNSELNYPIRLDNLDYPIRMDNSELDYPIRLDNLDYPIRLDISEMDYPIGAGMETDALNGLLLSRARF